MPQSSTNLKNRVNKLHLPKTKSLLPVFEIISNAIHSIDEKKKVKADTKGVVHIDIIRSGQPETLAGMEDVDSYPITSLVIADNGIGLNSDNYASFLEFDSEYKSEIGGKGIGRLVALKAFFSLNYQSYYQEDEVSYFRNFEYKKTKEGFDNYEDGPTINPVKGTGTKVTLYRYEQEYQKNVPFGLTEVAREIISHFQIYFIQKKEPKIVVRNQNKTEINLTNLFNIEFKKEVLAEDFFINSTKFTVVISKSLKAKSHKIHYCGHERSVKEEGLSKYITDLKNPITESEGEDGFYYQVFIVSDFLSNNVNEERTGFKFKSDDDSDDELEYGEISLARIRRETVFSIERLLEAVLTVLRQEKMEIYKPIIEQEFPNYAYVIEQNKEQLNKIPSGLTKHQLDLQLYEIESDWKLRVKQKGITLLDSKKDITTLQDYKDIYVDFLTDFNSVGQSDLARYVVHRRAVIDLLDRLQELNDEHKFSSEEIIHSLFFPIRETTKTVAHDKQNLWLLDERLTFNTLLSSEKMSKQVAGSHSSSSDRIDVLVRQEDIYEKATLFSEDKYPFESFTILEFKKPNRNDYQKGDEAKDPVAQVRRYVRDIIDGKYKKKGKTIEARVNTPFYCYIVADVTPTLKYILEEESFNPTPDGMGYFRFYDTVNYKAYIEVLPFKKVVLDAKKRNKILFDKLNLLS